MLTIYIHKLLHTIPISIHSRHIDRGDSIHRVDRVHVYDMHTGENMIHNDTELLTHYP